MQFGHVHLFVLHSVISLQLLTELSEIALIKLLHISILILPVVFSRGGLVLLVGLDFSGWGVFSGLRNV